MLETLKKLIMTDDSLKDFTAETMRKKQIDLSVKLILQELKKIQEQAFVENTKGSMFLAYVFENIGDQLIEDIIGELKERGFIISSSIGSTKKITISWKLQEEKQDMKND